MTKLTAQQVEEVLAFWFEASDDAALSRPREAWFRRDDAFDAEIRRRFLPLWQALADGELAIDAGDARAALAWLIVADQFPRNLFRGEARAFSSDEKAREGARSAVGQGWNRRCRRWRGFSSTCRSSIARTWLTSGGRWSCFPRSMRLCRAPIIWISRGGMSG
ncbi:Uncharacterized protein conserved in bacteria [Chromobacterium vaccinii]|nr:Uncharacterized protein conserved in bacteria [Chromobacterium vaccinii]